MKIKECTFQYEKQCKKSYKKERKSNEIVTILTVKKVPLRPENPGNGASEEAFQKILFTSP